MSTTKPLTPSAIKRAKKKAKNGSDSPSSTNSVSPSKNNNSPTPSVSPLANVVLSPTNPQLPSKFSLFSNNNNVSPPTGSVSPLANVVFANSTNSLFPLAKPPLKPEAHLKTVHESDEDKEEETNTTETAIPTKKVNGVDTNIVVVGASELTAGVNHEIKIGLASSSGAFSGHTASFKVYFYLITFIFYLFVDFYYYILIILFTSP